MERSGKLQFVPGIFGVTLVYRGVDSEGVEEFEYITHVKYDQLSPRERLLFMTQDREGAR